MQKSLPRGDHLVPLFIGDRQGLAQKQTVRVRACSCPDGSACAAEAARAGPGLLLGVLAPLCAVFLALAGQWAAGWPGLGAWKWGPRRWGAEGSREQRGTQRRGWKLTEFQTWSLTLCVWQTRLPSNE